MESHVFLLFLRGQDRIYINVSLWKETRSAGARVEFEVLRRREDVIVEERSTHGVVVVRSPQDCERAHTHAYCKFLVCMCVLTCF